MTQSAYLLLLHKDTEHVRFLIEYLSRYGDVFVHMDKKSQIPMESLSLWIESTKLKSKVRFLKNRHEVFWGDVGTIHAIFDLLKFSISLGSYRYFTLLSGDCVPVRPVSEFEKLLNSNNDYNYISFSDLGSFTNRIALYHFGTKTQLYRNSVIFRKVSLYIGKIINLFYQRNSGFQKLDTYKGSMWFSLTRDFVDYLIKEVSDNDYFNDVKYSSCCDEIFFHTIIMNSPFKKSVSDIKIRYIPWSKKSNSPRFLCKNDIPLFDEYFFARKSNIFDGTEVSTYLKDMLNTRY